MSPVVSQPSAPIPRGISDGGPTSVTRAPISARAWMFDRATREWRTSPTIATWRPSIFPNSPCSVYRSSSACVGCWCLPSPALTTCAFVHPATSCGAPISACRITITSGSYAPSVIAVSLSDSPLSTEEPDALNDIVSALSRFAASSKLDDVRVDDSKNRLSTSLPRSVGSFFTSRSSERSKLRAVASRRSTSSRVRSAIEIRCRFGGVFGGRRSSRMTFSSAKGDLLFFGLSDEQDLVDLVDLEQLHLDALAAGGRQVLPDVVGSDRELAVAAVDEARELNAIGAPVVEQRVDRRADRASRVEDVGHEDAGHPLEREVERRRPNDGLCVQRCLAAADLDVVAVERDVERAVRDVRTGAFCDQPAQALRDRHASRLDADERHALELRIRLDDLVRDP